MTCTSASALRARRSRSAPRQRSGGRAGFTLIEMLVAVVILSVGLLGLASTSAMVTRQTGGNATQTVAAQVIANRLETLRSLGCSQIPAVDSATTRRIFEKWVRGATVNRVLMVTDTVKYQVAGTRHSKVHVFTIAVPCQ